MVLLLPLIGMQNPSNSVVTLVLQADLQELVCRCCWNPSQIYLIHEKFKPRVSIVSAQRPNSNLGSMFTMQATGRDFQHVSNFVFPWIHPLGCDDPSSLGRVYSRQATA